MSKNRLEAFSDGVIAILITIMVLELRAPHDGELSSLRPVVPSLLSYVLSFIYLGIYWNNHHHLLHATERINGTILWANLHLLFWLSLIPFTMSWLAEEPRAPFPAAAYGGVLFAAAIAYTILARCIIAVQGKESVLARAMGRDRKGKISLALYLIAIPLAFVRTWLADVIYVTVAIIWFVPDRRIERRLNHDHH